MRTLLTISFILWIGQIFGHDLTFERSRSGMPEFLVENALGPDIPWTEGKALPDSLIRWGSEARQLAGKAGRQEEEARAVMVIAIGHFQKKDFQRALYILNQALEIYHRLGFRKGQGDVLHLIGLVYETQGDFAGGAEYYGQSCDIYERGGHREELSYTLNKLGDVYAKNDDHTQAMEYYRQGLATLEDNSDGHLRAMLNTNIGQAYAALGHHAKALEHLYHGLSIGQASGDKHYLATAQNHIGAVHLEQGTYDSAEVYLESAFQAARETGSLDLLQEITGNLVTLHELLTNHEQALHYFKIYNATADSLEREKNEARITWIRNDHAFEMERLYYQDLLKRGRLRQTLSMSTLGAALLLMTILFWHYHQKKEGLKTLQEKNSELLRTRNQLIIQEKMASLGQLVAGIAHEIKNPLNFVNNFAEGSIELADELQEELEKQNIPLHQPPFSSIGEIIGDLKQNSLDICLNGKRADRIVHSMMEHARGKKGEFQAVDINTLLDENINLAFHGYRALDSSFELMIEKDYDPEIGLVVVVPQDLGRVLLNIINNACYALNEKRKTSPGAFLPVLQVKTMIENDRLEISIRDNGPGIPGSIRDRIFSPFFTTKPAGEGNTGLGLSISYDIIVKGHDGELDVESEQGSFTEFKIRLPIRKIIPG